MMRPRRIEPGPGQESVWDYPRPPRMEGVTKRLQVVFNGVIIAETVQGKRVLETAGAPVYYFPPDDVRMEYLTLVPNYQTLCEWKGFATYYSVEVGDRQADRAAWCYPKPTVGFTALKDHLAFYPQLMDACLVNGEKARAQPGGFYGGWITDDIVGPFKGESGTENW